MRLIRRVSYNKGRNKYGREEEVGLCLAVIIFRAPIHVFRACGLAKLDNTSLMTGLRDEY